MSRASLAILVSMIVAVIAIPLAMGLVPSYSPYAAIVVDSSILGIDGKNLTGFIYIAIPTPRNLYAYSYPLTHAKTFVIDIRNATRDWTQFYVENIEKLRGKEIPLPTISITLFLYDREGNEYLVTYSYSTITYYLSKGLGMREAVAEALQNPLALFRQTISIELKRGMKGLTISKLDLGKAIAKAKQETGKRIVSFSSFSASSLALDPSTSAVCPDIVMVTYWDTLYNSIDNPPPGWYERVKGDLITDTIRKDMWNYYAYYYSQAYLFRSDAYTLDAALNYVYERLGGPGAYTMDQFVRKLASEIGYSYLNVWWDDVYPQGYTINIDVPIIGIEMHYSVNEPIEAIGTVYKFDYSYYETGIAFAGIILVGQENAVGTFERKTIRAYLNTPQLQFIMVPTTYSYIGDGFFLAYEHKLVTYNGCEYWEIIPISTPFVPYYMKQLSDLDNAYIYVGEPPTYSDLVWSYSIYSIYSSTVTNAVPSNTAFFSDDNVYVSADSDTAGVVTSLIKTLLDTIVSVVLGSHPVASMVYTVASSFFSYAEINAKITGVAVSLDLYRADTLTQPVLVYVDKYTVKDYTALPGDYIPLMTKYIVTVSPAS